MGIRRAMDEVLPPVVKNIISRALRHPGFYGDYQTFEKASADSTGYNNPVIAEAVAARQRPSGIELHAQLLRVLAAFCPAIAGQRHLSILDVGGANGAFFHGLRPFLPPLDWTILETPEMVRTCAHGEIRYVEDVSQLASQYDVVLMSGVLQYLQDPYESLGYFAKRGAYTILARIPFYSRDRLTVQRTPRSVYCARYPAWFFDETKFLRAASSHGVVRMRWRSQDDTVLLDGHRIEYQGMLIHRA